VAVDGENAGVPARPMARWERLRRPEGLVAQTRWLFTLLVLVSVLLLLPGLFVSSELLNFLIAVGSYTGLLAMWSYRYQSGRAPVLLGVLEAALVMAATVAGPDPASILPYIFASLWLRALYGTTRGALLHTGFLAVAVVVALWVWTLLPGRPDMAPAVSIAGILNTVPVMFLTGGVARYLARSLFAREQSQQRDAALLQLSSRLTSVTEQERIRLLADECAAAICAATPGLQLLVVMLADDGPVVVYQAGARPPVPRTVPMSVLPADPGGGVQPLPDSRPLAEATGLRGTWLGLPLGGGVGGWILLGAAGRVPPEAVVAVGSMTNEVALALRNSDAHHDLATQASEDPLTGLANRATFNAALEAALAAADRQHVALLFLDLDDFKIVNDGLGHSAGDELLRNVAARLRAGVRPDDLCARIGGDEFAVLLPDAADDAVLVGQRLVELIAAPVTLRGRLAQVGASVGLAFAGTGNVRGEQLVQRADIAMYAAKAKGKNRMQVFDPSLLQDDGRAEFESELAASAAADQLVVHYQPIVSVQDGRCVSVEALVRWQHPTRGLLHPAEFIPTAERTGAIVDIGELVLRRACSDAAAWSGPSGRLAVHVNVSAAQLTDPGFVDVVRSCVADFAMEPNRMVLEITEGMVLDSAAVRAALEAIAVLGVAIAIDDFGTGYSALSILRTLPLNIVKIDKSFLPTGPSCIADEAIVEAIVRLAGRLGLQIVAEGVERVDQQQFLRDVGADSAQGYLHLRPSPAPDFARWLEHRNAAYQENLSITPLGPRRLG
jgi:diguanylate cyclase (GGDEF)-like protein